MKYRISKFFVFFLATLGAFFLTTYLSFVFQNLVSGVSFIDSLVAKPFQQFVSVSDSVKKLSSTYDENKNLKQAIYRINYDMNELENLKQENLELRTLLDFKDTDATNKKIMSRVVIHNTVSWMDNLQVDAGKNYNITKNYLAVANGGLIGWVSDVYASTSRVNLLSNTSQVTNLTVKIATKSGLLFGVLEGYDKGKESFIVRKLNSDTQIEVGDLVSTSGLGDFPTSNIPVGSVSSVSEVAGGTLEREILIKPAADFSNLNYVMLVGE